MNPADDLSLWPELPLAAWSDTYKTLHMWTQVVGKVRLALSPHVNHWWETPLYVSARGLTTSSIPFAHGIFEMEFDFIEHMLRISASTGQKRDLRLFPQPVADFYRDVMAALDSLGIQVKIWPVPVEIPDPIAFPEDHQHAAYDPEYARRHWQILISSSTVLQEFRGRFVGKCSPVHFFWGSFDLAVTRFSGRPAPPRTGADPITREAYSHEVISAGFWPGGGEVNGPAYYCYAAPEPGGFAQAPVRPASAFYHAGLKEFLLMYDDVRRSPSPRAALLDFLQSTYEAGANLGGWDRKSLEAAA